ncbi:MAG: apolipoprotein N-acyltransferase [Planctomycetota bacterium]
MSGVVPADAGAADDDASPAARRPAGTLAWGLLGAAGLWLAQPPVAWWPLAWVAPAAWLRIADREAPMRRADWAKVWLAGAAYWLMAVHWVRLPHPLTPIGWVFLAAYLGLYPLLTVAVTRRLRRRWGTPLWLAGAVAWTAAELIQARLFTGFLMGAVSHSQAHQAWVRSIAAWAGAYGVTFVVVAFAGAVAAATRDPLARRQSWNGAVAGLLLAATVGLGAVARRTNQPDPTTQKPATVALIQGDTRATWDPDPGRGQRIMDRQVALSRDAFQQSRAAGEPIDLLVWPESMFRSPLYTFDGSRTPPQATEPTTAEIAGRTGDWFASLGAWFEASVLVGVDRFDWRSAGADSPPTADAYNSVALASPDGELLGWYDKTHLVPFGEYIPLARGAPALYYLTPMAGGLNAGAGPVALRVPLRRSAEPLVVCPSVCYETVVPHLARSHVARLAADGDRPDVMVNVTNDAWFWGSSELDMHLACGVFRATETGTPLLVAANGGLSAVIDATGEVLEVGPRMAEHTITAAVPPRVAGLTLFTRMGDWFAWACLLAAALGVIGRRSGSRAV